MERSRSFFLKQFIPVASALLLTACTATTQQPANSPKVPVDTPEAHSVRLGPVIRAWAATALPKPDGSLIAAASHIDGYFALWHLNRDRKVELAASYPDVGFHPDGVRWADLDGDGRQELIIIVEGINEIQFWDVSDDGKSIKKLGGVPSNHAPRDAVSADLDQDGIADIIAGPYRANEISILWGKGGYQYDYQLLPTPTTSSHPRIVDWDKDGRLDVVWADWLGGSIRFARNLGGRQFEITELQPPGPGTPRQIALADMNGDGHVDLASTKETGKLAVVLYNDGHGKVASVDEVPAPTWGYSHIAAIGGEQPMLALTETHRVMLARKIDGTWQFRQLSTETGTPRNPEFVDADADGHVDLLVANSTRDDVDLFFGPLWENSQEVTQ